MNVRLGAVIGWLLALLGILGFTMLGFWQLDRARQKQAMLDEVARVLEERKVEPLSPLSPQGYDWAEIKGTFMDGSAILLDNQQRDGRSGVRVYRLFEEHSATDLVGMAWLVELGWLPVPGDRTMPQVPKPEGEFELRGLLAPPPSHGIGATTISRQRNGTLLTTSLDAPQLPELLGVRYLPPRVLRLDPALKLGYARDLDVLPNTMPPARHIAYAVQWFGLALTVLITAAILSFRRHRSKRAQ